MTMRAYDQTGSGRTELVNFHDDMLVLDGFTDWGSTPAAHRSRFRDDEWYLYPLARKETAALSPLRFWHVPAAFRDPLKRAVWCMVHRPAPAELLERPTAMRPQITGASAYGYFRAALLPFSQWLDQQGIDRLCDVSHDMLERYLEHVLGEPITRGQKHTKLWGVTRVWLCGRYLPERDRLTQPPWEAASTGHTLRDLLGEAFWSAENKTKPIQSESIAALYMWCRWFVENMSNDILQAKQTYDAITASGAGGPRQYVAPGDREKWARYLEELSRDGGSLPSYIRENSGHRAGRPLVARRYLALTLDIGTNVIRRPRGFTLAGGTPLDIEIHGRVEGKPWTDTIDFHEVERLVGRLATACMVVIAYVTGMRPEECRALKRGCCRRVERGGERPPRFEIRARSFKLVGPDGNAVLGGQERADPWYAIKSVAEAVSVMERLHDHDLLFPKALFSSRHAADPHAYGTTSFGVQIDKLIAWCNKAASRLDLPGYVIEDDPAGPINMSRFRRTLAVEIYKNPDGRVATGVQYGHLHLSTTDGYGANTDRAFQTMLQHADAAVIAGYLEASYERRSAGEEARGIAAERLGAAQDEFAARFVGKHLGPRELTDLRNTPNLRVYHNKRKHLVCVYDPTQALCHPENGRNANDASSPMLPNCKSGCPNIARTDSDIDAIEEEIQRLTEKQKSPSASLPAKVRYGQEIDRLRQIVADYRHAPAPRQVL